MVKETKLKTAAREQISLAKQVVKEDLPPYDRGIVTGVDVHYHGSLAFGCAAVIDAETLKPVQMVTLNREVQFDYIPGYLYLREGPIVLDLLKLLDVTGPVLIDGNGVLHPRRLGLASHVGVVLNIQAMGVAKSLHIGTTGSRVGDEAPICDEDEVIGMAVWLGKEKPVFVSVGNNVTLATSVRIVRDCAVDGYPEPLRRAHRKAKAMAREQ
ncbi:MAG: endonuclease V [Candidatus Thorarchaeota archaeon]|jgi:deoxyribonuclease V